VSTRGWEDIARRDYRAFNKVDYDFAAVVGEIREAAILCFSCRSIIAEVAVKKLVAFLLGVAASYPNISAAGNWIASPAGSAVGLMQRLDRAHWIAAGPKSPKRVVYVFTDPNCPFCHDLWKAMNALHTPEVQVRYLLVAVISADSRGKDAAILESADPAAALEKNERNFDNGGIAPKPKWQAATSEAISANEALMQALGIYGTPGLVYLDEHNEVKVFAGMPDPGQLRKILDNGR
jgi:thiol:disulfide interchange protein DsbG